MATFFTLPILLAGVVLLGALVSLVWIVLRRDRVAAWIQALFRRPEKPPRTPGPGHYYKAYWS